MFLASTKCQLVGYAQDHRDDWDSILASKACCFIGESQKQVTANSEESAV